MKIGEKTSVGTNRKKGAYTDRASKKERGLFSAIFGANPASPVSEEPLPVLTIDGLLDELGVLGRDLSFHRSPGALERYKDKVRQIVNFFVENSTKTVNQLAQKPDGRYEQFYLTHTIDEKLAELAKIALDQEKNHIDLVAQIDNIRGILIDYLK